MVDGVLNTSFQERMLLGLLKVVAVLVSIQSSVRPKEGVVVVAAVAAVRTKMVANPKDAVRHIVD